MCCAWNGTGLLAHVKTSLTTPLQWKEFLDSIVSLIWEWMNRSTSKGKGGEARRRGGIEKETAKLTKKGVLRSDVPVLHWESATPCLARFRFTAKPAPPDRLHFRSFARSFTPSFDSRLSGFPPAPPPSIEINPVSSISAAAAIELSSSNNSPSPAGPISRYRHFDIAISFLPAAKYVGAP